jgi:hypothetical protein
MWCGACNARDTWCSAALQGALGILHERQMTSVFMHVRQLWLASSINRTMNKHSQHTTVEDNKKQERMRALLKREEWVSYFFQSLFFVTTLFNRKNMDYSDIFLEFFEQGSLSLSLLVVLLLWCVVNACSWSYL